MNITSGYSIVLGYVQLEVFQVKEFPGYNFSILSGLHSFGLGFGFIKQGNLQINYNPEKQLEKMRDRLGINWLGNIGVPVIIYSWIAICGLSLILPFFMDLNEEEEH